MDALLGKVLSKIQLVELSSGVPLDVVLSQTDPIRLVGTPYEEKANWDVAMNPLRWLALLEVHPRLAGKAPWDEFTYDQLVYIIMHKPELIPHVDPVRLDQYAWEMILFKHPRLLPHCDQSILGDSVKNMLRLGVGLKFEGDL